MTTLVGLKLFLKETNPKYYELISHFGEITGVYALLNTSLNHHGKPIVSNFEDALYVFDKSDLDGIILGDYFYINSLLNGVYI